MTIRYICDIHHKDAIFSITHLDSGGHSLNKINIDDFNGYFKNPYPLDISGILKLRIPNLNIKSYDENTDKYIILQSSKSCDIYALVDPAESRIDIYQHTVLMFPKLTKLFTVNAKKDLITSVSDFTNIAKLSGEWVDEFLTYFSVIYKSLSGNDKLFKEVDEKQKIIKQKDLEEQKEIKKQKKLEKQNKIMPEIDKYIKKKLCAGIPGILNPTGCDSDSDSDSD